MKIPRTVCLPALLGLLIALGCGFGTSVEKRLKLGHAAKAVLAHSSELEFLLSLESGQHVALKISAPEGGFVVAVANPAGRELLSWTVDSEEGRPQRVSWVTSASGTWKLVVRSLVEGSEIAVLVEWLEYGPATSEQRAAWHTELVDQRLASALAASDSQIANVVDNALELSGLLRQQFSNQPLEAGRRLDALAYELCQWPRAEEKVLRAAEKIARFALELQPVAEVPEERSESLSTLSIILDLRGRWSEAIEVESENLEILRLSSGDDRFFGIGDSQFALGNYLRRLGRSEKAMQSLEQALSSYDEASVRMTGEEGAAELDLARADVLNTLAGLQGSVGNFSAGLAAFEKAERFIAQSAEESGQLHAAILNNLGGLYRDRGDYITAQIYYQESLEARKALKAAGSGIRRLDMATAYLNLGEVHRFQGRYRSAKKYYERALRSAEADLESDHPELVWFYSQSALLYQELGESGDSQSFELAESFFEKALEIARGQPSQLNTVGMALRDLGRYRALRGDFQAAEDAYRESLTLYEQLFDAANLVDGHPEIARTATELAGCLLEAAEVAEEVPPVEVEELIRGSLRILRGGGTSYPETKAMAYLHLGRWFQSHNRFSEAIVALEQSIGVIESLRSRIGGGERGRQHFGRRYVEAYDLMIELQVIDYPRRAFEYAEGARARTLLERLLSSQSEDSLLATVAKPRRAALADRWLRSRDQLMALQRRVGTVQASGQSSDLQQLPKLLEELDRATLDADQIAAEIRQASPVWQSLTNGPTISASVVQNELLGSEQLMLLYHVGDRSSFLFLVPPAPEAMVVFQLAIPPQAARALGVESGPLTRSLLRQIFDTSDLEAPLASLRRPAAAANSSHLSAALAGLWQTLIPQAASERLVESKEVVLVPDSFLHLLPFEALVVSSQLPTVQYWLDEPSNLPAIRYGDSATTLYELKKRGRIHQVARGEPISILSVSDPCFSASEAEGESDRCRALGALTVSPDLTNFTRSFGGLGRLAATATESRRLAELFADPSLAGEVATLQGHRATEAAFRASVQGKRFLHLATHGLLDQSRRGRSAALAFAPDPSSHESGNDGFLWLSEVHNLELSSELAVLSACQTHVGPLIKGDGITALSHGFLVAGAEQVVASLWQVQDLATAELIGLFFESFAEDLSQGRPVDYAAALVSAKRQLRRDTAAWSEPYYWAPFVLTGTP